MVAKKDKEMKEGLMLKTLGTIMHGFASEPALAKARALIQPHVKELRFLAGKQL